MFSGFNFELKRKQVYLQFHDQVDFALVFVRLQQLDDIGVLEPVGKPTNKNGRNYTDNLGAKTARLEMERLWIENLMAPSPSTLRYKTAQSSTTM